jgi:transposase
MPVEPTLTDAEWHAIAAHLRTPPTGRPRIDDRGDIAKLCKPKLSSWRCKLCSNGKRRPKLIVKRSRWREDGTWNEVEHSGQPAMERMRAGQLRALSLDPLELCRCLASPRAF